MKPFKWNSWTWGKYLDTICETFTLGWKYVLLGSQWRGRRNTQFRVFSWDRKRGSQNVQSRDSWKEASIWNMLLCLLLLSKILRRCRAVPIHSSFVFTGGTQSQTDITGNFGTIPSDTILINLFLGLYWQSVWPVSADAGLKD